MQVIQIRWSVVAILFKAGLIKFSLAFAGFGAHVLYVVFICVEKDTSRKTK
jgi:hypothetical protein